MPEVAVIAAVAGAGVSAYSAIQQGKIAEQTGKFNAALASQEAETIDISQEFEERETRVAGRKLRARQLLQFASGGVVPTTGTPLLVQRETGADVEKEIGRQKFGFGLQKQRAFSRGRFAKAQGKALSRASRFQAGSSLLTGAYRVGSIYN